MPKLNEMFPARWLAAADLDGSDRILQIRGLTREKVGADQDEKWTLWFYDEAKGLILNKTNTKMIASLLGEDTDEWLDREIILYPTEVDFAGESVEAIRVRRKLPKPSVARSAATRTPAQATAAAGSGRRRNEPLTQQEADEPDETPF